MIVAILANNVLPIFGIVYICTIVWKIARRYHWYRWFF